MSSEQRAQSSERRAASTEHRAQSSEKRWGVMYAGVLLFLVLQILLYAWFTEAWR